jgi:vacuolar protein sorting-associated protein 54
VHAAVPDGKAVDAMILSTVKRKASSPLNGTDHEVCAFRIFCSCI